MVRQALRFYRRHLKPRPPYGWSGDYPTWSQAKAEGTGYDANSILEKVQDAALKVKRGQAVYERDSVLFNRILYSWPVLAALLWVAAKNQGRLNVADFGGSLGTSYFQNKRFLDALPNVSWNVVEQENFVRAGRAHMQDDRLRFHLNVDECIAQQGRPDLIIVSGVLQYMEEPYALIQRLTAGRSSHIILDNMPFNFADRDRITVQKVPPSIYPASYPCWFLSYPKVQAAFAARYDVVSEHQNDDRIELDGREVPYRGFLLQLKS